MKTPFLTSLALSLALGAALQAELTHRYSFLSDASDSVGTAHAIPQGAAVVGGGFAYLDGSSGTYLELPPGLIQGYEELTIEAWVTFYSSDQNWTRLFDFGGINGPVGRNYIMFTPHSSGGDHRLSISDADPGYNHEEMVVLPGTLDDDIPHHIVAVFKPAEGWMAVYEDGVLVGANTQITIPLSAIDPENCFIGRSLYAADGWATMDLDELRIHDKALTAGEVIASLVSGPDLVNYDPGSLLSVTVNLPAQVLEGARVTPELTANYAAVGEVVLGPREATITSSDPLVLEVQADGSLIARGTGTVTVTADVNGVSGTATVTVQPNPAVLAHRWSFNESPGATTVKDSVGGADGTVRPSQAGSRQLTFDNGKAVFPGGVSYTDAAYIDLPDGIISSKQNITIEVWTTWNGPAGSYWQRIFDFGNSQKGDNPHNSGNGTGGLFLTPLGAAGSPDGVQYNAGPTGFAGEQFLTGPEPLPIGQQLHIVCTYAPDLNSSQLWINGRLIASALAPWQLSELQDQNNWLGASQWNDPPFNGTIDELRIYEGALSELEIILNQQAGPDALPPSPGLLQSVSLRAPTLFLGNPDPVYAELLADYENVQDVNVSGLSGSKFTSSDPGIFIVDDDGGMLPVSLGTATLTATFQGQKVTTTVEVVAPTALSLTTPSPLPAGGMPQGIELTATYPGDLTANAVAFEGVTYSSSNPDVATVDPATGAILPVGPGTATITAQYGGLEATAPVQVQLPEGYQPPTLIHRYTFDGVPGATLVEDVVGDADGELINPSADSTFTGTGRLKLQGGPWNDVIQSGYVNLPNGMFSSLPSVTVEGWINWAGPAGSSWQRIFDVGRNSAVDEFGNPLEDVYANPGVSYMFLTPQIGNNTLRFGIKEGTGPEVPQLNAAALPVGQDIHFALVYDTASGAARLYVNGQRVAIGAIVHPLSVLEDINVYLGRSQWTDPYFAGEFDELRVYEGALLDREVALSYAAGPDTLPDFSPPPVLTARIEGDNILIEWPASATGYALHTSNQLGPNASWTAVGQAPVEANGMLRVSLPITGSAAFYRLAK